MSNTITQADVSGQVVLSEGKYTLDEDITVTQPFTAVPGTIFDGSGHTITIDITITEWPGLFSAPVTVMNLTVMGAASIADDAGVFFATDISGIAYNCVNNCTIRSSGGGIFGKNSAGLAISCQNTGFINNWGGGIFGQNSAGTAVGCINSSNYYNSGGIFGISSSGAAINCSNSGSCDTNGGGGIFGSSSTGTATNCFNSATLNSLCGGIFGAESIGTATNCYNSGGFSGTLAGGIFGSNSTGHAVHCFHVGGATDNDPFSATDDGSVLDISNSGSGTWDAANQYLLGVNGEVWVTPGYTLSPFRTNIESLSALFPAAPHDVITLPKTMGFPDSEIAFATALSNDSSKYGNLSQLNTSTFTYTPTEATILYQDRGLNLSGPLNIVVPSGGGGNEWGNGPAIN
jgi:hypothetical protein